MIELTKIEKEKVLACVRFVENNLDIQKTKLEFNLDVLNDKKLIAKGLSKLEQIKECIEFYDELYRKLKLMWR